MKSKLLTFVGAAVLAVSGAACGTSDTTNISSTNANAVATTTTQPGPDNSEITTSVDANGVKTETRVFHNNPRVAKVVVTTRDGRRTTTVYAPSGESKDLTEEVGDALVVTGDALADGARWTADKAEDVAGEAKDAVKTGAEKTAEGAKTAADKTKEGAEKVADKTKEGAKKVGSAIKKAIP